MLRSIRLAVASVLLIAACGLVPQGATAGDAVPEATSLFGKPLYSAAPSVGALAKYQAAKADYDADPGNADKLIWYGRRTAYLGRYNDAIAIFSDGVKKFPKDARILRHRGHRYITTRQFDKAIADFEKAHALIAGKKDEIEPDGAPNSRGIPVSTLNGNIRYHLGLAYYLKQDWKNARRVFAEELKFSDNDDRRIAASHWYYMTLRRMGAKAEAAAFLRTVPENPDLIENEAYLRVLRFDKGEITEDQAMKDGFDSPAGMGIAYGIANRHHTGDRNGAFKLMNKIVGSQGWGDFGYIAAEADLAANRARSTQ
jgi:tetratricopeptide (TPR) repeat protein